MLLKKLHSIASQLAIKHIAVLGFICVITPLFAGLLIIAEQTKLTSRQGAQAILAVSTLVEANQDLSQTLTKAERFASQFMVLKEVELLKRFTLEHDKAINILDSQLGPLDDKQLNQTISPLHQQLVEINQQLPDQIEQLADVTSAFKQITLLNQDIRVRSDQLIQQKAHAIRSQTQAVDNLVYQSLVIIPISLLIAIIFIYLISQPLKQLTEQIDRLAQENFERPFTIGGPQEINEIAHALEAMRVRLQALELQKSSFIRHISHELKTPLAAIREGSALLNDNSLGPLNAGQHEVSGIIINSVKRLQQLIEDLLAFNIVLDSTSLQDSEPCQLSPLISEVINQHKLALQKKHLSVDLALADIQLVTNRKQLSVVLENLLSNAIKYVPQGGNINISTSIYQDQLQLTVADNGPGMSEHELNHIFDAFYQGQLATNREIDSSGLGLTIVHELIMRLNGSIEVKSTQAEPDHGSQFIIFLPRVSQQEP